ncbi:ATP synthase mitochondrial F1 complex assembly factor 1 isoform X1 [Latimeria chalumnae]|uniref:ATP synthase mitochondrial F1 complex assembly factor 1 isoform X1 n=2 Tax=Latimeria chalumnae TaxID=7897 RepID=UPI00313F3C02
MKMAAGLVQLACLYKGVMAVRGRALRPLCLGIVSPQLRAFSVRREAGMEENPFYGKYQEKIQELCSSNPEVFESRMEMRDEMVKQPIGQSKQEEFVKLMEQESETLGRRTSGKRGGFTKQKTLDSILNVDMVKDKTAEEISQLWKQYFATRETICAVIPGGKFDLMWNRAQNCPTFLYALPREEGYEFFVGQWSGVELHFTSLINIQTVGETAPSQLILYHYPELQKDKDIVLMTAEMDSKFLGVYEAQCLANQAQLFYVTDCEKTFGLVQTFNHSPANFKHTSVIEELERCGLGTSLGTAKLSLRPQNN